MTQLRLGILGQSDGNGHPYSWAAIFNGYDSEAMKSCPFPVIMEYLGRQKFPDDAIADAIVTHVWTQDHELSKHIAAASRISLIVNRYEEMIGHVDAILLARDDAENHYEMSLPFLEAGLPIYIDKPLAYTRLDAERIYSRQQYDGQVFTCSALTYADELTLTDSDRRQIGKIKTIDAVVMKDWNRYGVHIIEPVLQLIGDQGDLARITAVSHTGVHTVEIIWESGLLTRFSAMGTTATQISINVIGERSTKRLTFTNTFAAFKGALQAFVAVVRKQAQTPPKESVMRVIQIIEAGSQHG